MPEPKVQERVNRVKSGLPTHGLIPGYYWVRAHHGDSREIARWDGNAWHGFGWHGGGYFVDVLSGVIMPPSE